MDAGWCLSSGGAAKSHAVDYGGNLTSRHEKPLVRRYDDGGMAAPGLADAPPDLRGSDIIRDAISPRNLRRPREERSDW